MPWYHIDQTSTQSTMVALLAITTVVGIARLSLPFVLGEKNKLGWRDAWLATAFVCFLSLAIVYLETIAATFRILGYVNGAVQPYPALVKDADTVLKATFAATMLHWFVLYGVKFSLLAFYRKLMDRLATYMRLWWIVLIYTCLCLLTSLLSFWLSCDGQPANIMNPGRCLKRANLMAEAASLWMAYALDITSDILIMLLPLGLIRNAHLPLRQKISIGSVFCLALVCVAVATVRVCEVGKNMTSTTTSDLTWLALWSLVEAAIAIIIGCAPGFYEATKKARTAKPSSKGSSQSDSSNANSRRTHWRNASRDTHGTAAPPMYSLANNKTQSVIRGNAQSLDEDEGSAIELSRPRPLRHAISVTRSTRMTSERNNTSRSYSLYPVERDSTPLIPPERLSSPVSNESQTDLERDIGVAIARARA